MLWLRLVLIGIVSAQPPGGGGGYDPTHSPTPKPSHRPTPAPTHRPSRKPTPAPSLKPTSGPSLKPTRAPSPKPTLSPSPEPSALPSPEPTEQPTQMPSLGPTQTPTSAPSIMPTHLPSILPTASPQPSSSPTSFPSHQPTSSQPTSMPTPIPSTAPSSMPTHLPTRSPTSLPSAAPTQRPSSFPTSMPTILPSHSPTIIPSPQPTSFPTSAPSLLPSAIPTSIPTKTPTLAPSSSPSELPSPMPTALPSRQPQMQPTSMPTGLPTLCPSTLPTLHPTSLPTVIPSASPTNIPTFQPTELPTVIPSAHPTTFPTFPPTDAPTLTVIPDSLSVSMTKPESGSTTLYLVNLKSLPQYWNLTQSSISNPNISASFLYDSTPYGIVGGFKSVSPVLTVYSEGIKAGVYTSEWLMEASTDRLTEANATITSTYVTASISIVAEVEFQNTYLVFADASDDYSIPIAGDDFIFQLFVRDSDDFPIDTEPDTTIEVSMVWLDETGIDIPDDDLEYVDDDDDFAEDTVTLTPSTCPTSLPTPLPTPIPTSLGSQRRRRRRRLLYSDDANEEREKLSEMYMSQSEKALRRMPHLSQEESEERRLASSEVLLCSSQWASERYYVSCALPSDYGGKWNISLSLDDEEIIYTTKVLCPSGYYETQDSKCESCLSGAVCDGLGNNIYYLELKKDYWRSDHWSTNLLDCDDKGFDRFCLGGNESAWGRCRDGHKGPYCSVCHKDYYTDSNSGLCRKCTAERNLSLYLTIGLSIAGVISSFIILIMWRVSVRRKKREAFLKGKRHAGDWRDFKQVSFFTDISNWLNEHFLFFLIETTEDEKGSVSPLVQAVVHKGKIMITFFQVLLLFAVSYNISWPDSYYSRFLGPFDFLNLNFFGFSGKFECFGLGSFYSTLVLQTQMPVAVSVIFFCYLIRARRREQRSFAYTLFLFYTYMIFPNVSRLTFEPFQCQRFDNNMYRLRSDYSISCKTNKHHHFQIYALVMIFIYPVGIPLAYFLALLQYRDTLMHLDDLRMADDTSLMNELNIAPDPSTNALSAHDAELLAKAKEHRTFERRAAIHSVSHLRFLYGAYQPQYYMTEVFECIRKLCLTGFIVFFYEGTILQLTLGTSVALVSVVSYAAIKPYRESDDSMYALLAHIQIFVTLFCSVLLTIGNCDRSCISPLKRWHVTVALCISTACVLITGMCLMFYDIVFSDMAEEIWDERKKQEKSLFLNEFINRMMNSQSSGVEMVNPIHDNNSGGNDDDEKKKDDTDTFTDIHWAHEDEVKLSIGAVSDPSSPADCSIPPPPPGGSIHEGFFPPPPSHSDERAREAAFWIPPPTAEQLDQSAESGKPVSRQLNSEWWAVWSMEYEGYYYHSDVTGKTLWTLPDEFLEQYREKPEPFHRPRNGSDGTASERKVQFAQIESEGYDVFGSPGGAKSSPALQSSTNALYEPRRKSLQEDDDLPVQRSSIFSNIFHTKDRPTSEVVLEISDSYVDDADKDEKSRSGSSSRQQQLRKWRDRLRRRQASLANVEASRAEFALYGEDADDNTCMNPMSSHVKQRHNTHDATVASPHGNDEELDFSYTDLDSAENPTHSAGGGLAGNNPLARRAPSVKGSPRATPPPKGAIQNPDNSSDTSIPPNSQSSVAPVTPSDQSSSTVDTIATPVYENGENGTKVMMRAHI